MTAGEGETYIADKIEPKLVEMPKHIKLAYLPSLGSVRLRLTGKSNNPDLLKKEIEFYTNAIIQELGDIIYGYNDETLEEHLLKICKEKDITLSVAESCTGGYLAHKITSVPGSSAYFIGGIVSYDNEIKKDVLKVKQETLVNHGAVSEETVIEMLNGLLDITKTSIGVSISGIAGPEGGTDAKPVGTIWIALGSKDDIQTYKLNSSKDRLKNIEYAAIFSINKLRHFIKTHY
jgi:nicotinamide-nucleotide amidase